MPQKPFQPAPNDETDPFDLRYRDEPPPETPPEATHDSAETVRSFNLLQEIRERLQRLESGTAGPADLSGQTGELITSLKADRDRANEQLTEARRELGKQEEKCRLLRKQVDFVQKKYTERNKRVAGLKVELSEARKQAEATLAELRQRLDEQAPSDALSAELDQARQRCAALESEVAALKAAQAEQPVAAPEVSETLQRELDEAHRRRTELEAEITELRAQQAELQRRAAELTEATDTLRGELESARQRCAQLDRQIAELQEAAAARERLEAELTELRSELDARQQAREAAEARLAEAEDLCRQRQARIDEVTAALDEQRQRLESDVAEARRQLEEQREQSQADLSRVQRDLEEQRGQWQMELADVRRQLDEEREQSQTDLAQTRQQIEDQRTRYETDLAEAHRQLEDQRSKSEADLAEAHRQLEDQRAQSEADLTETRRQLDEQRQACEQLDVQLNEARALCRQSEDLLAEVRTTLDEQRRRAEADLATAERLAEDQQKASEALEAELNEARDALAREREAARLQLEEHKSAQQALNEQLAETESRLSDVRNRATELEETLTRERQTATVEMETLRQDLDRQSAECRGLQEQLAEARRLCGEHEQHVAELEDTLAHQRQQGENALALAEQQLAAQQEKCDALDRELEDARQRCREAQEQVAGFNELIGKERETARTALSEAREQLQHQQHQVQALHARLLEAKQYDEARDRQIADLKQALSEAAERIVGLEPESEDTSGPEAAITRSSRGPAWPATAKAAVAAAIVLGLISAGVTSWFYERGPGQPNYRIAGLVSVPSANAELLATCQAMADREKTVRTEVDRDRGIIELSVTTHDPEAGLALVNRVGEAIATEAIDSLRGPPDTQPAVSEEYRQRREQLAELDQQLSAIANRPATVATEDASRLLATWRQLRTEQQKVADAMADLAPRLNPPALSDTGIEVNDQDIARAEAANQQLQADMEALQQREVQLTRRLRAALDAGLVQFRNVKEAIAATSQHVNGEIEADHPAELDEPLRTMQDALTSWSEAVGAAAEGWDREQARFEGDKVDTLVAQATLEKAARAFIEETDQATASFQRALDALGQGDGQVTRRLVLRNALAKQFSALTDAQSGALAAARAVVMSEDVELASIVQRLTGLRQRVEQLRAKTAESIRRDKLTDLQNNREQELAQARAEHDRLIAAATELDEALLKTAEQAVRMVTEGSAQQSALMEQADLQRRRAEAMRKLMELQGTPEGASEGRQPPPPVRFLPAVAPVASDGVAAGTRLRNALLAGSVPLIAFVVIGGVVAVVSASRRSSRTMEDYARCLIEAAQQSHKPPPEDSTETSDAGQTQA